MDKQIPAIFGEMVFNDAEMKARLPHDTYEALHRTIELGRPIDIGMANVIADAMKDWAVEKGATHFTHWFHPMTGYTAEKHDSFITPQPGGAVMMEFSGKELVKGEPDASSFPSGGLRATFEARGYTAWDPTSYAFVKDNTLCIPTAFCSFRGEVLDKKTPLLRSTDAVSREAVRVLRLFGRQVKRVSSTVGAEQEYFLIDKKHYAKREDLILTGRTLFGAPAPKGQEMEDHYFGSIRPRVKAFMEELDIELWRLGIYAKTEHNEAAPCQHEMAPVFTTVNIATDQNQLTMEVMKRVADRHGLVCLLHEKPFEGINGSGKHNNWSISTDDGENLFEPGDTPSSNAQFLLFLTAIIKGVDEYQDLLRLSVASAGNDRRLGADEAPPAIVSVYVGDELERVIGAIVEGSAYEDSARTFMNIGVTALPRIPKDNTDRNRTSPFAFTGNKFEFRMLGSDFNIGCTNVILNTIMADELAQFAEELEQAADFEKALAELITRELRAHERILFSGNGYSREWQEEAERRGLLNLRTTPEALERYTAQKNLDLFARHGIYTAQEVASRREILLDEYVKTVRIEARTMLDMIRRQIVPAVMKFEGDLAETAVRKENLFLSSDAERGILKALTLLTERLIGETDDLEKTLDSTCGETLAAAYACAKTVLPAMEKARATADDLEKRTGRTYWPFPTYEDILFYV
ncbi:MAG: glutamine synthetase III [Lachnospiraceae bacterium]|nr:glutamine synthetase III [Lachnospiraceae bacterium]